MKGRIPIDINPDLWVLDACLRIHDRRKPAWWRLIARQRWQRYHDFLRARLLEKLRQATDYYDTDPGVDIDTLEQELVS